ncbi:hypothetical protein L208DRAFT_1394166 [Tricholoma matsutake]|nr:hypothetical protein L208DRAFT_1394166 [Tricholoma matsutake 945]
MCLPNPHSTPLFTVLNVPLCPQSLLLPHHHGNGLVIVIIPPTIHPSSCSQGWWLVACCSSLWCPGWASCCLNATNIPCIVVPATAGAAVMSPHRPCGLPHGHMVMLPPNHPMNRGS